MPIDFGSFEFAAPIMTGELWVLKTCKLAGLGGDIAKQDVNQTFSQRNGQSESKLKVSIVRHPCHWLSDIYSVLAGDPFLFNSILRDFSVTIGDGGFDDLVQN